MRPRVVISVLLFALAFIGLSYLLTRPRSPGVRSGDARSGDAGEAVQSPAGRVDSTPARLQPAEVSRGPTSNTNTPVAPAASARLAGASTPLAAGSTNVAATDVRRRQAERAAYIRSRVATLSGLATKSDAASLEIILSELTNPEKAIRSEALEAAVQFGSSNAIPRIKEIASTIEDPREKVELLDAADFLALPGIKSLRPSLRQKNAARQTPATPGQP